MLQAEQILHERYQLKQKLGQNAGRQTWLAEDISTGDRLSVIVKLLCFGGEVQWEDLKLFEREAQVLKQLNHPRIPKYRDYFSIDERSLMFGLVQEYIPGSSLKELLSLGKKFTEPQVRQLAEDVLKILIYLHELNPPVLHRDIKPSNLIWGEDNQVYLVDFGAVQDKAAQEGATFTVVGTYGYAPMEQFGGRTVPASDLYALGASLIHLLTGTAPADLPQDDLRIQFSDRTSASPDFIDWIENLTEPSLKRRFSSARQALEALEFGLAVSSKTHNSIQTAKNSRPAETHVQVRKSPERLQIKIPLRGLKTLDLPILLLKMAPIMIIVYKFFFYLASGYFGLMLIPVLIFSVFVWATLVFPTLVFHYGGTYLKFNREYFQIERQLLGFTYNRQNWPTSMIQYVFCRDSKYRMVVAIQVKNRFKYHQYLFGQNLTQEENAWLAQEIQSWLNFR